jgi:hypothetical protein
MSRLLHDIGGGNEGSDLRQYGDVKFGEGRRGRESLSRMEIRRRSLPDLQGKFGQRREWLAGSRGKRKEYCQRSRESGSPHSITLEHPMQGFHACHVPPSSHPCLIGEVRFVP